MSKARKIILTYRKFISVVYVSPKDENDILIKRVIATEHQIIQTRYIKKEKYAQKSADSPFYVFDGTNEFSNILFFI